MRHSHLMTMSRFSFSECALLSVVMERAVGTHLAEARSTMYVLWYLLQAHTQIAIDHSVHAGWSMLPLLLFTFVFGCGVYACVCACGTDVSVNLIRLQNWFQELWNIQSRFARSTNAAYARILSAHMILLYQLKYTHKKTGKNEINSTELLIYKQKPKKIKCELTLLFDHIDGRWSVCLFFSSKFGSDSVRQHSCWFEHLLLFHNYIWLI